MPCDAQPSRSPATIVSATAATWASVRPNRVSTACASARTSPSVIETIWVMSLLRQDFVFDQRRRHHAGVVPCVEEIAQPEWPALLVERVRIIGHDMIELQFADDIAGDVARLGQKKGRASRGERVCQ